ncbi:hypothetical protein Tco_1459888, partial [Tanacetum coccineum]
MSTYQASTSPRTPLAVPLSDFAQTLGGKFRSKEVEEEKWWCCGFGAVVVVRLLWFCCFSGGAVAVVVLRWWFSGVVGGFAVVDDPVSLTWRNKINGDEFYKLQDEDALFVCQLAVLHL